MTPKAFVQQSIAIVEPPKKAELPKLRPMQSGRQEPEFLQLMLGLFLGVLFGVLLQKGGVAKYHILIGALMLEDFTVMKVMLTAIVVGMVGVFTLHSLGMIQLQIKPTRYSANIFGGLIFGVGFGLIAYCPGTGAAAIGQGNYDALAGVLGLIAGSYLFAEASGVLERTVNTWGDRGRITLADLLHVRRAPFIAVFVPLLILVLAGIQFFARR